MQIPFGPFAPDLSELDVGVCAVALNVYPGLNSYSPILAADTPYSDALPEAPRGLFLARKQNGTFVALAGTDGTLQRLDGNSWTEIGSGFNVPVDEFWSGVQFGTTFIFTNITDGAQAYDLEAGGSTGALSGSPPAARFVDVIEDYVVLASLASDAFAIAWSDTNDAEEWSTGNSGSQSFPDGGRVQNFAGAAGLVVQETAIRDMIHAPGSAEVFQFQKREQAKGTIAPYSVIKFGPWLAYLAEDGFWFNDKNISAGRITKYFFEAVDRNRLFSVIGTFDPNRPVFYWLARTSEADNFDFGLIYNWQADKWSAMSGQDILMASNMATTGITLEQIGALYPILEDVPYSLDSRVWQGGRPVFGVINGDFQLAFFEGAALEATLETGEKTLIPGRRAMIRSVRPMVDASAAVVAVGRRERQADARTWTGESVMQPSGRCPVRASGRLFRCRVRIPAGTTWRHATGVEIEASAEGGR